MNLLTIICTCGAKFVGSASQARRANWKLWTGGATCAACRGEVPPVIVPVPIAPQVRIKCSECDDVTANPNEFAAGGFMPGIHWRADLLSDAERRDLKAALRTNRRPVRKLPLCPGMQKPGVVLPAEATQARAQLSEAGL